MYKRLAFVLLLILVIIGCVVNIHTLNTSKELDIKTNKVKVIEATRVDSTRVDTISVY